MTSPRLTLWMTAWLALGIPLCIYTLMVNRVELDLDMLQKYDELAQAPLPATIRIAVEGDQVPDLAAATQFLLNQKLAESVGVSPAQFIVDGECTDLAELCVHAKFGTGDLLGLDSGSTKLEVEFSERTMIDGRVPEVVAALLVDHVYKGFLNEEAASLPAVTVRYTPNLHLTFSLFSEQGELVGWQAAQAIQQHLGSLLDRVSHTVVNLTVDTQTALYARTLVNETRLLDRSQLTNFVDFAEWPLASLTSEPTLNFVLYVPSSELEVMNSKSNSFVIPQWGGVVVSQPLDGKSEFTEADLGPVMQVFGRQLLVLLGMREPQNLGLESKPALSIRLNELARRNSLRGLKAAAASIGSLKRLVASMPAIPVPQQVKGKVLEAQLAIDNGLKALSECRFEQAAEYAANAFIAAEQAFFNKDMVAQAFFPDEHKLAVYMPLIGPLCIVVISGWSRQIKKRKKKKAD